MNTGRIDGHNAVNKGLSNGREATHSISTGRLIIETTFFTLSKSGMATIFKFIESRSGLEWAYFRISRSLFKQLGLDSVSLSLKKLLVMHKLTKVEGASVSLLCGEDLSSTLTAF